MRIDTNNLLLINSACMCYTCKLDSAYVNRCLVFNIFKRDGRACQIDA